MGAGDSDFRPVIPAKAGIHKAADAAGSKIMRTMRITHPGESILLDCLEPLGLSVAEGAERLGVRQKVLASVVSGRAGVSPEMAVRLDREFGGGAATWLNLQAAYDTQMDGQDA